MGEGGGGRTSIEGSNTNKHNASIHQQQRDSTIASPFPVTNTITIPSNVDQVQHARKGPPCNEAA